MISARSLKPELEIPDEVWKLLLERDFVNFAVPLLNPPAEKNGVLTWSGRELMTVSPSLAAFYADEEAELFMPYGEMFKVLANESKTVFAQIYAVFFEKLDGEWRMIYRMMNCSRAVGSKTRDDLKSDSDILSSNWMLSLSGTENWLTLDAYLDFYCKFESYDKHFVAANIYEQLDYMEGPKARLAETRIMPMPGGTVVLVSSLRKGWALVVDVVKNSRTARFVMDDPPHLIESFWRLHSKMFLDASDQREMEGMICDARHFSRAIKSAREQMLLEEELTAAAFYC